MKTPAPARARTSANGRPTRAAKPPESCSAEHGGWLRGAAQLRERLGQGGAGRGDPPGHQEQTRADSGAANQRGDHRVASAADGAVTRNRAGSAGLVILASQAKAAANRPPTNNRTSWPTPLP